MKKYFKVIAKCGHVGKNNYTLKTFAVISKDAKKAALTIRNAPRVKHHHKDAIRMVEEIDINEYRTLIFLNRNDPYFISSSRQQEKSFGYTGNEIYREKREEYEYDRLERKQIIRYKLLKEKYKYSINC